MVLTSSRILSCEVWLILMRNTSAPASNRRRIIALSEEAGPSVARILIRRRRLMALFRALRVGADQPRPEASRPTDWAGRVLPANRPEGFGARPGERFPEYPARAAPVAHWIRSVARSRPAALRCRPRRSRCGRNRAPDNFRCP